MPVFSSKMTLFGKAGPYTKLGMASIPGRTPKKGAQLEAGLEPQLQAYADVTLERHCELWEQVQGVRVSPRTMGRAIKRLDWTRKKRHWQPVNATRRSPPAGESK